MNWFDYTRGYDDGMEDYRSGRNGDDLLFNLVQFAFAILILVLQLTWWLVKCVAGILWTIIRLIAGRKR